MFQTEGSNKISLRWKSQKIKDSEIIYESLKASSCPLKKFIREEKSKGAKIVLDFLIDGIDLGAWLNTNYFKEEVIGLSYSNSITHFFNCQYFNDIYFSYQKIILKRILGQLITLQDGKDCESSYYPNADETEIKNKAEALMFEENKDTMLYCSACCGDRDCGYFGIKVFHTDNHVIWQLGQTQEITRFEFEKKNYFEEFKEYLDLVNNELKQEGITEVNIQDEGTKFLGLEAKIDLLKNKYELTNQNFDLEKLKTVFKSGDIEEIDAGICFAASLGFDLEKLKNEIENDYNSLPKKDKDAISWKIIKLMSYFNSSDLNYKTMSIKAHLLFS